MNLLKNIIKFIASNFGPLVGFYLVNHFWDFQAAVLVSILLVIIEFLVLKMKKQKVSAFFYFSSAIIIVFGVADLVWQESIFFKFEASMTNLFFALFFGLSLFKEKPIIQEFAEMQKRTSEEQSPDKKFFFRFFTILWCGYFILKSAFYLWIGFHSTLEEGLMIRMLVGKVSFWIMMFVSIGLSKQIWRIMEKLELFPSQRKANI